ncbi:NAD(P)-dependent oxidoreductase [Pseudaminobacter sp. 19-2017]|uniref:NAD(P)-dependent oxidoreductase n=1 Tax=Pseudaminobacter soli (ex Zhang et al. 2022) TaxID=2831468 RepID=A0A942I2Y0_9HYPH|nr:NAD(P)-dependent oxidoreductase [Pseudaminobacter soli]MBS3649458.1 NAD(P)-dependent oxidoreductase [Pseudaminobacter soli]
MRVIVTGSSGFLGRHVAGHLVRSGHAVRGVDVSPPPPGFDGWSHVTADLTDLAAAFELVRDAEAVVHIAAIPRPTGRTAGDVFHTNVSAAFNVVEATRLARIPRLVYASSFSVLGYPFGEPFVPPQSLPVDEKHPTHAQDPYGLSKWLGEEIVEAAVRGGGLSAVSLRLPWVQSPETFAAQIGPRSKTTDAVRDLWSYIDVRDAAEGFRLALDWPGESHLRAYLSAADTYLEEETASALERGLPGVPLLQPLDAFTGLISTRLAQEELGFVPRHSWRDYANEEMA